MVEEAGPSMAAAIIANATDPTASSEESSSPAPTIYDVVGPIRSQIKECLALNDSSQREDQRKARKLLRVIWDRVSSAISCKATEDVPPLDVLIEIGEAAQRLSITDLAISSIMAFLGRSDQPSALIIRCLCLQAWTKASLAQSHGLHGVDLINHILQALAYLMQALDLALSQSPHNIHPIYNISLSYWNIARPLFREGGAFRSLVPSMTRIVDALEQNGEWDKRWRVRYLCALAMALDDAGQFPQAINRISMASQLAKEVLEQEKLRATQDAAAFSKAHKDIDAIRGQLRRLQTEIDEANQRSQKESLSEEEREAAKVETALHQEMIWAIRGIPSTTSNINQEGLTPATAVVGELEEKEKAVYEAETALEASSLAHKEAMAMVESLLMQSIYLARKGDTESKKLLEKIRAEATGKTATLRSRVLYALQSIRAGILSGTAEVEKQLDPLLQQAKSMMHTTEGMEAMVDLGLAYGRMELWTPALECLDTVMKGKSPQAPLARVKIDFLKAMLVGAEVYIPPEMADKIRSLVAQEEGGGGGGIMIREREKEGFKLALRADAIQRLERGLMACRRLGDVAIFHEGCLLAWNMSLPLLEPHLRFKVYRLFQFVSQELEKLDSPLYQLRAYFHTELGKMELSSDLLANAKVEIEKAFRLDYGELKGVPPAASPSIIGGATMAATTSTNTSAATTTNKGGKGNRRTSISLAGAAGDAGAPSPPPSRRASVANKTQPLQPQNLLEPAVTTTTTIALKTPNEWAQDLSSLPKKKEETAAAAGAARRLSTAEEEGRKEAENERLRPLDRYLLPLQHRLDLKANLYGNHTSNRMDQALLLLEQAKLLPLSTSSNNNTNDIRLKEGLLTRAASLLRSFDKVATAVAEEKANLEQMQAKQTYRQMKGGGGGVEEGASSHGPPSLISPLLHRLVAPIDNTTKTTEGSEEPLPRRKVLIALWFQLAELAWSIRHVQLLQQAVIRIMDDVWSPSRYPDLIALQVKAQHLLAQSLVETLVVHAEEYQGEMITVVDDAAVTLDDLTAEPQTSATTTTAAATATSSGAREEAEYDPLLLGIGLHPKGGLEVPGLSIALLEVKQAILNTLMNALRQASSSSSSSATTTTVSSPTSTIAGASNTNSNNAELIENGCIYLWNYHLPAVKSGLYKYMMPELLEGWEIGLKALRDLMMNTRPSSSTTAATVGGQGRRSSSLALMCRMAEALASAYEGRRELSKAQEVAQIYLPLGRPMQVKGLIRLWIRVSNGKGLASLSSYLPVSPSKQPPTQQASRRTSKVGVAANSTTQASSSSSHPDTKLLEAVAAMTIVNSTSTSSGITEKEREDAFIKAQAVMEEDHSAKANALTAAPATAATAALSPTTSSSQLPPSFVATMITKEEREESLELRGEIWTKITKEHLSRQVYRKAQASAQAFISLLPTSTKQQAPSSSHSPRILRWASLIECLWARSVIGMIDPTVNQEKSLQDHLIVVAAEHCLEAARYAFLAKQPGLLTNAAHHLWNMTLPLHTTPRGRRLVFPFISSMLTLLTSSKRTQDSALKSILYPILFQTYADEERWNEGLRCVTEEAFPSLPISSGSSSYTKALWQWKVIFMSKLGRSVLDGIAQMKTDDPVSQAKVWASLARSSTRIQQQLYAYSKVFRLLGERFEKVHYYLEAAKVLVMMKTTAKGKVSLLHQQAQLFLSSVVDTLMEVHELEKEALEADDEISVSSSFTSTTSMIHRREGAAGVSPSTSPSSAATLSMRKKKLGSTYSFATTKGGRTGGSSATLRSRTMSSKKSSAASTTNHNMIARLDECPSHFSASHYEMMIRTLIMQARPDGYPTHFSASHYEMMIRTLIMQAQLTGSYTEQKAYCLQALHYIQAFITSILSTLSSSSSKSSPSLLPPSPTSLLELATMQINPALLAAIKKGSTGSGSRDLPSSTTIPKASFTLHYLYWLATTLSSKYLALPIHATAALTLAQLIAEVAAGEEAVKGPSPLAFWPLLARTRRARFLYDEMGLVDQAREILGSSVATEAGRSCLPLGLTSEMMQLYGNEGEEVEELLEEKKRSQMRMQKDRILEGGSPNRGEGLQRSSSSSPSVPLEVRHVWMYLAEEALALGQTRVALEYLHGADRHSQAYNDVRTTARCHRIKAEIARKGGRYEEAWSFIQASFNLLKKQGEGGVEPSEWSTVTCLMASILMDLGEGAQAERVLSEMREVLTVKLESTDTSTTTRKKMLMTKKGEVDSSARRSACNLDVLQAWIDCSLLLAQYLVQRHTMSLQEGEGGCSPDEAPLKEGLEIMQSIEKRLCGLGLSTPAAQVATQYARLLHQATAARAQSEGRMMSIEDYGSVTTTQQQQHLSICASYEKSLVLLQELLAQATPPLRRGGGGNKQVLAVKGYLRLPMSVKLCTLQVEVARLEITLAKVKGEHIPPKKALENMDTTPVDRWLRETKRETDDDGEAFRPIHLENAVLLGTSAGGREGEGVVGEALLLLSMRGTATAPSITSSVNVDRTTTTATAANPTAGASSSDTTAKNINNADKQDHTSVEQKGKKTDLIPINILPLAAEGKAVAAVVGETSQIEVDLGLYQQAISKLQDAISQGIKAEAWSDVGQHALAMVDACLLQGNNSGSHREGLAHLLLYQSCAIRPYLLHAFLMSADQKDRQAVLIKDSLSSSPSPLIQHLLPPGLILREISPAWRRLDCSTSSLEILDKHLPSNLSLVTLQFSSNQDALYVGIGNSNSTSLLQKIDWSTQQQQTLQHIQKRMALFKKNLAKHMQVYGEEQGAQGDLLPPSTSASSSTSTTTATSPPPFAGIDQGAVAAGGGGRRRSSIMKRRNSANRLQEEAVKGPDPFHSVLTTILQALETLYHLPTSYTQAAKGPDPFHTELTSVLQALETLLSPVLLGSTNKEIAEFFQGKTVANASGTAAAPTPSNIKKGAASPASATSSTTASSSIFSSSLVLLLDQAFLALPMEGLQAFTSFKSISRDFSLHILHHRLSTAKEVSGKEVLELKGGDLICIADPRQDDPGNASLEYPRPSLQQCMEEIKKTYLPASASSTTNNKGSNNSSNNSSNPTTSSNISSSVPSIGEWQSIFSQRNGGGVVCLGTGWMLAQMAPKYLAGINAKGCQACLIIDQMQNDQTSRRQSKLDTDKSTMEISAESPMNAAILLSLAGVNSLVINQWATSFYTSTRFTKRIFENLTKTKLPFAESIRLAAQGPVPASNSNSGSNNQQASSVAMTSRVAAAAAAAAAGGGGGGNKNMISGNTHNAAAVGGGNSNISSTGMVRQIKAPSALNPVVYGLPSLTFV